MPQTNPDENPYKTNTPDLTKATPIQCYINSTTSGYIKADRYHQFGRNITEPNGQPLVIDRVHDFYVTIGLVDADHVLWYNSFGKQLPSTLFANCDNGDYIHFKIRDEDVILQLDQSLAPKPKSIPSLLIPYMKKSVAEMLILVRNNIAFCQVQYPNIDEIHDNGYNDSVTKMRHAFFRAGSPLQVNGPCFLGQLGHDDLRELTPNELRAIPTLYSKTTLKLGDEEIENQDGTTTAMIICIGRNDPSQFKYLKTSSYIHLFVDSIPPMKKSHSHCAVTLTNPKFQNGIDVISFVDGVLILKSRLPEQKLEHDTSIALKS